MIYGDRKIHEQIFDELSKIQIRIKKPIPANKLHAKV